MKAEADIQQRPGNGMLTSVLLALITVLQLAQLGSAYVRQQSGNDAYRIERLLSGG